MGRPWSEAITCDFPVFIHFFLADHPFLMMCVSARACVLGAVGKGGRTCSLKHHSALITLAKKRSFYPERGFRDEGRRSARPTGKGGR